MSNTSYQPPNGPFSPLGYQAPASTVATKSRRDSEPHHGYEPPAYRNPDPCRSDYQEQQGYRDHYGYREYTDYRDSHPQREPFRRAPFGADANPEAKTSIAPRPIRENSNLRNSSFGGSSSREQASGGFVPGHYLADNPADSLRGSDYQDDEYEENSQPRGGLLPVQNLVHALNGVRKPYLYLAGIAAAVIGATAVILNLGGNDDAVEPDKTTAVEPVDVSTVPSVQLSTDPATTMAKAAVSTPSVGAEMLSKMTDVYVNNWHFSAARVIQILTNSEVTHATPTEAQTAIDSLGPINWNGVALAAARDAIANEGVPPEGIHDYLVSTDIGFTEEQAQYAVQNLNQIP